VRTLSKILGPLFLLLLGAEFVHAQTPDCIVSVNLTLPTQFSTVIDNRQKGCTNFTFFYQASGFSALSVVVQGANGATAPGSYATVTAATGSNPSTVVTTGVSSYSSVSNGYLRVLLTSATGTGTVTGTLYGFRSGYATHGGGGSGCNSGTTTDLLEGDGMGGCSDAGLSAALVANVAAPLTAGDCTEVGSDGVSLVDAGSPCGSGGSGCSTGSTTNVLQGNGTGGCNSAGFAAAAVALKSGTTVSGHCTQWGSTTLLTDAGAPCGIGTLSFSGTPTSGHCLEAGSTTNTIVDAGSPCGSGGGGTGFFALMGADLTPPPASGGVVTAGNHTGATATYVASNSAVVFSVPGGSADAFPAYFDFPVSLGATFTLTGSYLQSCHASGGRMGISMREAATGASTVFGNDMGGQYMVTGYPGGGGGPNNSGTFSLVGCNSGSCGVAMGGLVFFKISGSTTPGGTMNFAISSYPAGPWASVVFTQSNNSTTIYDHFGIEADPDQFCTMTVFDLTIGA
jgi:hypothetical protein